MKNKKKFRNTVFFVAVFIFATVAVFGYLLYNKPHRDVLKAKTDYTISAPELLKEFETNSTLASEKYNGKILLVSGKVESIKVSPSNSSIQLSCEGSFFGVNCSFNTKGATNLLENKIGNEIRVKGECKGYIDDVILNNCFLIK
jgi:amino acid permease